MTLGVGISVPPARGRWGRNWLVFIRR